MSPSCEPMHCGCDPRSVQGRRVCSRRYSGDPLALWISCPVDAHPLSWCFREAVSATQAGASCQSLGCAHGAGGRGSSVGEPGFEEAQRSLSAPGSCSAYPAQRPTSLRATEGGQAWLEVGGSLRSR